MHAALGADFEADGRSRTPNSQHQSPENGQGRTSQPRARAAGPDADDARIAAEFKAANSPHRRSLCLLRAIDARAFGRQPTARSFDRQKVSQPRLELPGPDSGRKYRSDAR